MRKATIQWLKSAEMDLDNIAQIIDLEHLTLRNKNDVSRATLPAGPEV